MALVHVSLFSNKHNNSVTEPTTTTTKLWRRATDTNTGYNRTSTIQLNVCFGCSRKTEHRKEREKE